MAGLAEGGEMEPRHFIPPLHEHIDDLLRRAHFQKGFRRSRSFQGPLQELWTCCASSCLEQLAPHCGRKIAALLLAVWRDVISSASRCCKAQNSRPNG